MVDPSWTLTEFTCRSCALDVMIVSFLCVFVVYMLVFPLSEISFQACRLVTLLMNFSVLNLPHGQPSCHSRKANAPEQVRA